MNQKNKFKQTEIGKIPEGWSMDDLKGVCEQIFSGGTPNTRIDEYWNGDLRWLSSGETRQTFIRDTERKITQAGVDNSSTRLAKKEDVVVAGAGQGHTRGQPSICLIDTYVNQSVVVLRSNRNKIHPFFLFYNLLSRYNELRQLSDAHSSRGSLTTKLLAELPIKLPSLKEQKILAKVLSDLDFKIELNNKMNKTLEDIGQALFKRWFVDEKKDEWKKGKLGDLTSLIRDGTHNPPKRIESGIPLLTGKNVQNGFIDHKDITFISEEDYNKIHKKYAPEVNDLIITKIGTVGNVAIIRKIDLPLAIHCNSALIRVDKNKAPSLFLYFLFKSKEFQEQFHMKKQQTVQEFMNLEQIYNLEVILPNKKVLEDFEKLIIPIFNQISMNNLQSQGLSQIRDSLLPKLMSGEIRVK